MKQFLLLALSMSVFLFSCQKDNKVQKSTENGVVIEEKAYSTITIGDLEWTTHNYDGEKGVYFNNEVNHDHGKFLSLKEVKSITLPEGWRIPTVEDYKKLANNFGNAVYDNDDKMYYLNEDAVKSLMSSTEWFRPGNNTSGFNLLPTGEFYDGEFSDKTNFTSIWASDVIQNNANYEPQLLAVESYEDGLYDGYIGKVAGSMQNAGDNPPGKGCARFVRDK